MARITFTIPEELARAAEDAAEADRRSVSSYITRLVELDLGEKGRLPDSDEAAVREMAAEAAKIVGHGRVKSILTGLLAGDLPATGTEGSS